MKRNRKLATLIKCVNEKLPVLKTLTQRRPDLYKSAICILCNKDHEEDQDHLATCSEHEKGWESTENMSIDLAWTVLAEETQRKTSKEELKKLLWGTLKKEKLASRSKIIKGLTQEKTKKSVQDITQLLKETRNFITVFTNAAWNDFFENIWKK